MELPQITNWDQKFNMPKYMDTASSINATMLMYRHSISFLPATKN